MTKAIGVLALLVLSGCAGALHTANPSSDEPEYARDATAPFKAAASYAEAVRVWETPADVNAWIAANVSYDIARAMSLSETQRTKTGRIAIYRPSEFFEKKAGVCVDLSRFGVETLRTIDPASDPKYLMIEFDPVEIKGHTLRRHWLVSFKRGGKIYFFSDSKRPGHIAGPYDDTRTFIDEYERYRGRRIVAFRELESYEKQRRSQARRQPLEPRD